ncbi:MAG: hypothetical protein WC804_08890 [Sphingomonas sp.]|jgi:hypothetical protein|uniref:hypothetical protein n=1 Tax=Sphingomonas sp. TaxID=28214 RepID=UPI003564FA70
MRRFLTATGLLLIVASCATPPRTAPAPPRPVPTPVPAPAPSPSATPVSADWRDWPVTPGDWVYRQDARGSIAFYGVPGSDAALTLRCDRAAARIFLSKRDAAGAATAITVRTSTMLRTLAAQPTGGAQPYIAVSLSPHDALLDAMAFSRGRFIVEQAGQSPLVVPSWAEFGRVVEDCRG